MGRDKPSLGIQCLNTARTGPNEKAVYHLFRELYDTAKEQLTAASSKKAASSYPVVLPSQLTQQLGFPTPFLPIDAYMLLFPLNNEKNPRYNFGVLLLSFHSKALRNS